MSVLEGCLTTIDHHVFHPRAEAMTATAVWFRAMPNKILREFWVADERQVNTNIKHGQTWSNNVKHGQTSTCVTSMSWVSKLQALPRTPYFATFPHLFVTWVAAKEQSFAVRLIQLWVQVSKHTTVQVEKMHHLILLIESRQRAFILRHIDSNLKVKISSFRIIPEFVVAVAVDCQDFDCAAFHHLSHCAREWRHSHLLGSLASCHMQRSSAAGAHLDASGLAYHEWEKQITGVWNRMDIFGCHWRSLYT